MSIVDLITPGIKHMAEQILIQDNVGTSHPICVVEEECRVYGVDEEGADGFIWMNQEGQDVDPPPLSEDGAWRLCPACRSILTRDAMRDLTCQDADCLEKFSEDDPETVFDTEDDVAELHRRWFQVVHVMVQPFFTQEAADQYLQNNRHNMLNPRVHIHSGYRNTEWQAIRHLLAGVKE